MVLGVGLSFATPAMAQSTIDWPSFGGSALRTNVNSAETILSTGTVPNLKLHWSAKTRGARNQPSLVRAVQTAQGGIDLLLVTSPSQVMALNAATGRMIWTHDVAVVAPSCENGNGPAGIQQPGTADSVHGRFYVVDGAGLLHSFSLANGTEIEGYPVQVIDPANVAKGIIVSHASPTLVGQYLYIATAVGGACEEKSNSYHDSLIKFDTVAGAVAMQVFPMGQTGKAGGGVWGPGGLVLDPSGPYLWTATANVVPAPSNSGIAEKIVRLDPNLNILGYNSPPLVPSGDFDFGSSPVLFQPTNCPRMVAALNKTGFLAVYNAENLMSSAMQILQIATNQHGGRGLFLGMAVFDPATNALYVTSTSDSPNGPYRHGIIALGVNASCTLSLLWQQNIGNGTATSPSVPPLIANGVVWIATGNAGEVAAFNDATGALLWRSGTTVDAPTDGSPMVANGQMFVNGGKFIYAFGL
jgi:outer membrane protein assembly factor BamB